MGKSKTAQQKSSGRRESPGTQQPTQASARRYKSAVKKAPPRIQAPVKKGGMARSVKDLRSERMDKASKLKGNVNYSLPETPRLLSESKTTHAALALLEKGIKLIYERDFKKARVELSMLLEKYPSEPEICARARSYLQICDREEAVQKKQPLANEQLYTLGVMEHNRGHLDEAISCFRRSLEDNPDADHVYYSLAASLAMKNEAAEAIQILRHAIDLNEENRIFAKNDPDFAPLREQQDFLELVGGSQASIPSQSRT